MRELKLTRDFYISNQKLLKEVGEVKVYISNDENSNVITAMGFKGKRQMKPTFHYSFKSLERRDKYIEDFFSIYNKRQEIKELEREKRKSFKHSFKVGDIFISSWGYDQTQNEYVQVVGVTEKSVKVREIGYSYEDNGYMSGTTEPIKDSFVKKSYLTPDGKPVTRVINRFNSFSLDCVRTFYKHNNGEKHYKSSYA